MGPKELSLFVWRGPPDPFDIFNRDAILTSFRHFLSLYWSSSIGYVVKLCMLVHQYIVPVIGVLSHAGWYWSATHTKTTFNHLIWHSLYKLISTKTIFLREKTSLFAFFTRSLSSRQLCLNTYLTNSQLSNKLLELKHAIFTIVDTFVINRILQILHV